MAKCGVYFGVNRPVVIIILKLCQLRHFGALFVVSSCHDFVYIYKSV